MNRKKNISETLVKLGTQKYNVHYEFVGVIYKKSIKLKYLQQFTGNSSYNYTLM